MNLFMSLHITGTATEMPKPAAATDRYRIEKVKRTIAYYPAAANASGAAAIIMLHFPSIM